MRKILPILVFLYICNSLKSQDKIKKHEVKIDVLLPPITSVLEVSYEYILTNNSSIGANLLYKYADSNRNDYLTKKSLNFFYRRYFNKNTIAKGFF